MTRIAKVPANSEAVAEMSGLVDVYVKPQPEGHCLATSEDIPGLIVEGETFEEVVAEVEMLAPILWQLNRGTRFEARIRYIRCDRP